MYLFLGQDLISGRCPILVYSSGKQSLQIKFPLKSKASYCLSIALYAII